MGEHVGSTTRDVIDGWVNMSVLTSDEVRANRTLSALSDAFGGRDDLLTTRTIEQLIDELDAAGVARAILSGTPLGPESGNPFGALSVDYREALRHCEAHPDRLRLGLYVDTADNVTRITKIVRSLTDSNELAIVRVVPSALGCSMVDGRLYHIYGTCEEVGVPVSINVGIYGPRQRSSHQHPMMLEDVLVDFPDLQVVAAHMGHPWEQLIIRLMAKFATLHLMTSAFSPKYFAPELVRFMNSSRGRDKVMFASDWPLLRPRDAVVDAGKLGLDDDALEAYLSGNLSRLIGWR